MSDEIELVKLVFTAEDVRKRLTNVIEQRDKAMDQPDSTILYMDGYIAALGWVLDCMSQN